MPKVDDCQVVRGSGNVFADLGRPHPESHLIKAQLVSRLRDVINHAGWSQAKAAEVLGIAQPDVSRMLRGHFTNYSVTRILRFLSAAGCEVDIMVRAPGQAPAEPIHIARELELA